MKKTLLMAVLLMILAGSTAAFNDDFGSYSTGTSEPGGWNLMTAVSGQVETDSYTSGNSYSIAESGDFSNDDILANDKVFYQYIGTQNPDKFVHIYKESSSSYGHRWGLENNGNRLMAAGTNNPQWLAFDGGYPGTEYDPGVGYYEWVKVTIEPDFNANEYDVTWEALEGPESHTEYNIQFLNPGDQVDEIYQSTDAKDEKSGDDDYSSRSIYNNIDLVEVGTSNIAPDAPDNPDPFNGENDVSTSQNLNVDVFDDDGDSMDVDFYVDGSYEGTDSSVPSGGTASINPSLSTGQNYDWYAIADDGDATTQSSTWGFNTVHRPNAPTLVAPNDNADDVSTSQNLQVDVTHDDGHSMDVDFYVDDGDGTGFDDVGRDSGVPDGGTASISPNLDLSGDYDWYAVARSDGYSTSSNTWSFETEHSVSASLSGPSKSPASIDPTLSATVSHSDQNEDVTVDFVNTDNGNTVCSISGKGNGQTATCDTSGDSLGSSSGTTYNWEVQISGDEGLDSETWTSPQQSFTTISDPNVNRVEPGSNSGVSTSQDLVVDVSHPDGKNMNVEFKIREGSSGDFSTVNKETLTDVSGQVSINPSLEDGTDYDWRADVDTVGYDTDTLSNTWSFTTNYVPSVSQISKVDASDDHAFDSVSAIVSDQDGDDDISAANLTVDQGGVSFVEYDYVSIDRSYEGSNEANVTFGRVNIGDGSWDIDNNINLKVEGIDSGGNVGSSSISTQFPNHAPTTDSNFSYSDDPQNHAFTLNVDAQDVDDSTGEIDTCTVEHRPEGGSSTTDSGTLNPAETATCSFTIDDSYAGYDKGDSIEHRVTFEDLHGASVTTDWASHTIPNSPPSATDLQPSGGEVQYGPTLNATYKDPDGDNGSLTFYNNDTGTEIGSVSNLAPGEQTSVEWSSATDTGTTYNFTVEAYDGLNSTNVSENFTTIYKPKAPRDPNPGDGDTVNTNDRSSDDVAASVEVIHPDGRPMDVQFVNASNDIPLETDFNVGSGDRAKITDLGNTLRDETNTTYEWYAIVYDNETNEYVESDVFSFSTVEVGDVVFNVEQGEDGDNMDVTGDSNNGYREIEFEISSTQMDPIPQVSVNRTSNSAGIKSWTDVDNNSVLTVDLVQDGNSDWSGLSTDSEYEYFIEAYEGVNELGTSKNRTIYTFNTSQEWNRAERYYDVYQYDLYRAQDNGGDLYFDHGNADYDLVGSIPETGFNDSGPGLEPGTFCWKVAASNPSGSSDAVPVNDGKCKTLN